MRLTLASVAVAAVVVPSPPASACRCAPVDHTKCDDWTRYPVVFDGIVLDLAENAAEDPHPVRFAVRRAWRGVSEPEVVVHTMGTRAQCGYPFREGVRYLVLANRDETRLWTGGCCSGTERLASDDVVSLPRPTFVVVRERPGGSCAGCSAWTSDVRGLSPLCLVALAGLAGAGKRASRRWRLRG